MKLPSIHTLEGRRSWAFIATVGGCIAFTLIIMASLWTLRNHPAFMFWLALAAHIQVFIGTGALGWVMGRRMTSSVTRDGASFDDRPRGEE